jgi:hypothetical protein
MSSVAEIEQAIAKLSREQFAELERWLDNQRNLIWDRQIEEDSAAGKLDFLLKEVDEDIAEGKTRPTDELCDES